MITRNTLLAWGRAFGFCFGLVASAVCGQTPLTNSVTPNGTAAYIVNGQSNPTLTLQRGVTYVFNVNATFHPFAIKTNSVTLSARYNTGVTGQGVQVGALTFAVPTNAPSQLFYHCENHLAMGGNLNIVDPSGPPPVGPVQINVMETHVMLSSAGASGWSAIPEFSSNLLLDAWSTVPSFTNVFANGTNITTFGRLDAICGSNVFLRVRNQKN